MKTFGTLLLSALLSTFYIQASTAVTLPLSQMNQAKHKTSSTPAVSPAPVQPISCKCPAGKAPTMFAGLCICGVCPKVSDGVTGYNKQCPDKKFTKFNIGLDKNCQGVENTEDCEFFKKSPGKFTDDYKRCKDMLDAVLDDCENQLECCSKMKLPEVPGAPKKEVDD